MATKRLTEKHPFMIKVNTLFDYMNQMGISIETNHSGGLDMRDTNSNQTYRLKDIEGDMGSEFPTFCEFKLTIEVDE